ncbi:hypothetical protein [Fructobacillus cardui]|uniref:hypothetical protein n=1 Tax=Fructobacillus cardui TaxID=2893170 RepID=UPI002DA9CBA9|nr:Uncharacterized membrane protein YfhO (YfhO) [Fructobacillus cardui]
MEKKDKLVQNKPYLEKMIGYVFAGLLMAAYLYMIGHNHILYFGSDQQFHYNRIYEYYENISHLNFFPNISTFSANEIGSNVITMYSPLPAYLGALIQFLFHGVFGIYVLIWLQFMVQFGIARFVAKEFGLNLFEADVVGIVFVSTSALVSQTMLQWLFGEVWAMSFMPLVVMGLYRLTKIQSDKNVVFSINKNWSQIWPLIVGFTLMLYSHLLSSTIVLLFTFVYSIFLLLLNKKRVQIFIDLVESGIIVLALSASFLLPFTLNTLKNSMSTPGPYSSLSRWAAPEFSDLWNESFYFHTNTIGLLAIVSLVVGLVMFFKFNREMKILIFISFLLVFSGTKYFWKNLYHSPFGIIQFPHRIFAIPIFILSMLLILEVRGLITKKGIRIFVNTLLVFVSVFLLFINTRNSWLKPIRQNFIELDYKPTQVKPVPMTNPVFYYVKSDSINNLTGYWSTYGAFDYLPKKALVDNELLSHIAINNAASIDTHYSSQPDAIQYTGSFKKGHVKLPFILYNNGKYIVKNSLGNQLTYSKGTDQRPVVKIDQDTNKLTIIRQRSFVDYLGLIISLLTILLLVLLRTISRNVHFYQLLAGS